METAKIFKCHPDAIIPRRHSPEAVGYDLHTTKAFSLYPGQRFVARTGLVIQPPPGYHTEILDRSGMAFKHNIMLINGVGLIDRDYAGTSDELMVMLYRAPFDGGSAGPVEFAKGDRIAQFIFRKSWVLELEEVFEAPGEIRGGLGSTGH